MDYTFIVVSYNSSKYIIEALESIRYQIETYGEGKQIELILGDDASQDNTCVLIDAWLARYEKLFSQVDRRYKRENVGTAKNSVDCWKAVSSRKVKLVAGDDLLPAINIFEYLDEIEPNIIAQSPVLLFHNGKVLTDYSLYKTIFSDGFSSTGQIRSQTEVCCPITNGQVGDWQVLTPEMMAFIEKFGLVEDQPLWYRLFHDNKDLRFRYILKPTRLYRYEGQGVSASGRGWVDVENFHAAVSQEKRGLDRLLYRYRLGIYYLKNRYMHIFSPDIMAQKIGALVHREQIHRYWMVVQSWFDEEQAYLKEIQGRAQKFMVELNVTE